MNFITTQTVELVLYTCMGYKEKETVLVVTDDILWDLGMSFYQEIKGLGIEVLFSSMKARSIHGQEPPPAIAESIRNSDIALLITSKSLSHTNARRNACNSPRKTRVASMPGADASRLNNLLNINYDEMLKRGLLIAELLKSTKKVGIKTKSGTNLTMEIHGRKPQVDSGILKHPGAFGNLPAGEIYLAPLEGTTNGTLVIDGSMAGIGLLKKPIYATVKDGMVVNTDSKELNKIIDPIGPLARNIAEFGIGTNLNAQIVGNILEDEKAINTIHIAIGDNISMGGKIKCPCHLDGIILSPQITLDGKPFPEKYLRPAIPPRKLRSNLNITDSSSSIMEFEKIRSEKGFELYQTLFENSNDPQYILDLKNQIFLEANAAFLSLTEYSREEMIGKLKSTDLTPQESYSTLIKKKENREKGIERERYEFKIKTKSGSIKPVEVSVHKLKLGGREVTLGSVRDISERLKLEKALRENITELALAGNRLLTLTEKIKNVPLLTTELLKSQDEEALYTQTVNLLCGPESSLKYKNVLIYSLTNGQLDLVKNGKSMPNQKFPKSVKIKSGHILAKIARGETLPQKIGAEVIIPIKGSKEVFGIIVIILDQKEKELMETNPIAYKSYNDVMETIVSVLGLLIESIELNEKLEIQSTVDDLTQVYNRRYFDLMLKDEVSRSKRYARNLSLLLLDLNKFKEINDTYGHKQGDIILAKVADLLKKGSRTIDIVCRYGGDEFAVILPETDLQGAFIKANMIYNHIKNYKFTSIALKKKVHQLTVSIGISTLSEEKGIKTEDKLLSKADEALYRAKKAKGRFIKSV
jgi:diguanylate cyclase (GGDEF)-like protein/PAS domain S-box-containing protein